MILRRFAIPVDGTIPIPALLYGDEDLLASQDGVGIYDGLQKAVNHQTGAVHVSSHRLFFVNSHQPISHSFSLDLVHIIQTDYYAGLFMSSPKVTLYLDPTFVPPSGSQDGVNDSLESWVCEVCNHRNPPGLSPAAARICALCGVPRSALSSSARPSVSTSSTSQLGSTASSPVALSTLSKFSTPPPPTSELSPVACTACTFLNHPSLRNCEICSTPLPLAPGNPRIHSKSAPVSRPASPLVDDNTSDPANPLIKLSFRKGGDKSFYTILRRALKTRAWEGRQIGKGTRSGTSSLGVVSPAGDLTPGPLRRSGIDGILRSVETSAQNTETELSDAFKDLEALMVKAQDLVHLAAEMNEKLGASSLGPTVNNTASPPAWIPSGTSGSSALSSSLFATTSLVPSSEPEEAKFIRSSLAQLGLQLTNAPVTADMIQDERTWMEELARELAGVLQGSWDEGPEQKPGIMKERGIIGLDEVWGGWNRARGVALIPPSTFLQAVQHLPLHTEPPIRCRIFKSGLRMLHIPAYTHAAFAARLSSHLTISGGQTTSEIAREENITISLATEMILAVEADGEICRDDELSAIRGGGSGSGSELRWALNKFAHYDWDGVVAL
ncbi:EAP30/Vps36 family-domain-containing protein [Boletus edulis BED1]|uniref:Vacuolar protein-sorting-associated protein 36 n=1 Tax=Boletus edulis BED1 TaxID=1328754 RepID=A0AAD4BUB2_BOLED|nr:EAP30/Vps36 family-domain-containing protein [Boletus edulis BED1]